MSQITREEIKEQFLQGIDCSQVVLLNFLELLGQDKDMLFRISAGFGGGMNHGETCGAVIGATLVLGLLYGDNKPLLIEKTEAFRKEFSKQHNSCICKEILHYDISKEEEKAKIFNEGLLFSLCPKVVVDSISILEEIIL